jgi:hypothetical protein
MVHACAHQDCNVLTMGQLCLEHEQEQVARERPPRAARVAAALALFTAGVLGAALRTRIGR